MDTQEESKLTLVLDVKDFRMDRIKQHYVIWSMLSKPLVFENSLWHKNSVCWKSFVPGKKENLLTVYAHTFEACLIHTLQTQIIWPALTAYI